METYLTRAKCYLDIWSHSLEEVATTYGIKPETLISICKDYNIPQPSKAYFTRKHAGEEVSRMPLPTSYIHTIDLEKYRRKEKRKPKVLVKSFARELEKELLGSLDRSRAPKDPRVEAVRKYLKEQRPQYRNGMVRTQEDQFSILVHPDSIDMACRFLNQFIAALHLKGYSMCVKAETTYVKIGDQLVPVCLLEKTKQVRIEKDGRRTVKYLSSGVFMITVPSENDNQEWVLGGGTLAEEAANLLEELKKYSDALEKQKWEKEWEQKQQENKASEGGAIIRRLPGRDK